MARTTRTAPAAPGWDSPPIAGGFGYKTIRIGATWAEIRNTDTNGPAGAERVTSVAFPIPDASGSWAVVQISRADGSAWTIGADGWLPDEWPTIETAVAAVCDRTVRKAMKARQAAGYAIRKAEDALAAAYAAIPPALAGTVDSTWSRDKAVARGYGHVTLPSPSVAVS